MTLQRRSHAVMDWSALRTIVRGNEVLENRMLDLFVEESARSLEALSSAYERRDLELARSFAHQLAGAAQTIGAMALGTAAKALEEESAYEDLGLVPKLIDRARTAANDVQREILTRRQS